LKVLKRPSKIIKSPYVADVIHFNDNETDDESDVDIKVEDYKEKKYLLHTPGLGCGGLCIPSSYIYAIPSSKSSKTDYTAIMSYCEDNEGVYYVGIHPMISQKACFVYLQNKFNDFVWNTEVSLTRETRIDFVGIHKESNKKFYVEVKNAMISYEESKPRSERRVIFPEASKKTTKPVSERALKHAQTLQELVSKEDTYQCMLLYTVPREDCKDGVLINPNDVCYHKAICEAKEAGVVLHSIGMMFDLSGIVKFTSELIVHLE
jgi:DNA-binding sugar fermentation-stimulating protein